MDALKNIVLTKIEELLTIYSPKGRFETINNRKWYGLSFCQEGQITYLYNGKEFVSDKNHAIFLPKGKSYSLRGDKKGTFPVINFSAENFPCDEFMLIPISDTDVFLHDFEQMKALSLFERNRAKVISLFYEIIHRLTLQQGASLGIIDLILNYIEKNYGDISLSNLSLAEKFGISEVYLRKLFSKNLGITPKQYILDTRITRAKQLLSEGALKISDVAEECGFSNQYHFCRIFKEKTGVTPTDYGKENRIYII